MTVARSAASPPRRRLARDRDVHRHVRAACWRRSCSAYFLGDPLVWSDELARYLFIWCSLPRLDHRGAQAARHLCDRAGLRPAAAAAARACVAAVGASAARCASPRCSLRYGVQHRARNRDVDTVDAVLRLRRGLRDRAGRGGSPSPSTRSPTRARLPRADAAGAAAMIELMLAILAVVVRRRCSSARRSTRAMGLAGFAFLVHRRHLRHRHPAEGSRWRRTRSRCSPRRCSS